MKNMNILLTGGSSGIGKALAEYFSKKNYNIIVLDNKKKNFTQKNIFFIKCDLKKVKNFPKIIQNINKKFKSIEVLINCARSGKRTSIHEENEVNWDTTMSVNLKSTFFLSQEVSKIMIGSKFGRIINISSVAAKFVTNESASYHASKAGIVSITKLFAKNLGKYNINVNTIMPGFILQDRYKQKFFSKGNKKFRNAIKNAIPSNHIGTSNDVAELIEFLISNKSKYINGEDFFLDGGSNSTSQDSIEILLRKLKVI